MIRRLFIVAVSLAALTACTTYNSGYRHYSPAQSGYGDYYYAPDPGPSYYSPGYIDYPAYYSLYWGFDRRYYSAWRQPHFHYGVTWFPNDWFAFSVVHRYPRYSYWHPYSPYRYSAWDHRFAWNHYAPAPRYRYRPAPRYGHPSNERHMQREQLAGGRNWRDAASTGGPRGRSALEASAPQRLGNAPQRAAYRPQSALPATGRGTMQSPTQDQDARMRQQAIQAREARLRDEGGRARAVAGAEARQDVQRPWQQAQPSPRGRTSVMQDAAPPRSIPDRRESQGPRQVMGDARGAPVRQAPAARMQDPRLGDAPRARPVAPAPVQQQRPLPQQRMPARQAPQPRQELRQPSQGPAMAPPRRSAMPPAAAPTAPQPRMQQAAPPRAAPAPAPVRQAPVRQAAPAPAPVRESVPQPRPATPRSGGRGRRAIDQEP